MNRSPYAPAGGPDPANRIVLMTAAAHYYEATGVECGVFAPDGRRIGAGEPAEAAGAGAEVPGGACRDDPGCRLCRRSVELGLRAAPDCSTVHRYGTYQAERFGGRYVYFCPSNLTHWAVPVRIEGQTVAALVGGPVLMIDPDEYLADELRAGDGARPETLAELRGLLSQVPFAEPGRVTALCETLYRVAKGVAAELAGAIPDAAEDLARRSRVAEYIHDLKRSAAGRRDARYPVHLERELLQLIARGDRINAQKVMNEILGHIFFSAGNDAARVRVRVQELVVLLSRAALEGGASIEEVFGLNDGYLQQLQRISDVDDIAAWLARILVRFSDCVFTLKRVKHADLIQKAIHFLNANYGRKIGLSDVAGHVYMSPSHFSKVFKEELGESFVDYLARIRVEKSRILLRDRGIPLIEVAGMVGFDDQSYFSKVFKKHTGMSPGRYRESLGGRGGDQGDIHGER